MAVLSRLLVGSQQRLDLPDILAIESYVSSDFKNLIKSIVGSTPVVLKGFEIIDAPLSINTKSVSIRVAGSVLYNPLSSTGSFFYGLEEGHPLSLPLVPELRADSTNYIYLTLSSQGYAQDTRAFWDVDLNSGEGGEFNQIVNTQSVLKVDANVSISTFPDGTIPIAKIEVNSSGVVEKITDCRNMMFRLGSGGVSPNADNVFSFRSSPSSSYARNEPPVSVSDTTLPTPFFGGDKNIYSLKEWMDVVMTKLLELSGTTYWYESAPTINVSNLFDDALGSSIKSKGQWTHDSGEPGRLTWSEDIVYRKMNDPREVVIRSNPTTGVLLSNDEVMFIDLIRNKQINSTSPYIQFQNGSQYLVGAVGSFSNLKKGDWIKKNSDNDNYYLRIETFYEDENHTVVTLSSSAARSIKLSSPYQGATDSYASAVYTKGEYTNSDVQKTTRSSSSTWLLGGNFYWLANRSDTVQNIESISAYFKTGVDIEESDGKRAKLKFTSPHGLVDGDRVVVSGASSYDSTYQVEIESDNVAIIETDVTTNATGCTVSWSIVTTKERLSEGGFQLESANHGFESNQTILISETSSLYDTYNNGLYQINNRSNTTFQIPYNQNTNISSVGTAACARINLRTEFGAAKVIQGESLDINEPDSSNILKFLGMDSLAQSSPVYAIPSNYGTLQGFQNFNSSSSDSVTERLSKLTAMMADRVQDRGTIIHGRVNFRNENSGLTQVVKTTGNLYIEKPGSPKQTINLPSTFSLSENQVLVIEIDREGNSAITPEVQDIYEPFLLEENKIILFYRFSGSSVYSWDGVEILTSNSWTSNDHENSQNKNISVIDTAGICLSTALTIPDPGKGYLYYKNALGGVKIVINGSSYDNTIDISAINALSQTSRKVSSGKSVWVKINRSANKVFNNIQTNPSNEDTDSSGSLYITDTSQIPNGEDVFVLYSVHGDATVLNISTLNHYSIGTSNIYEENYEITTNIDAPYTITLPLDSRNNSEDQYYVKGSGQLEVYLNGQKIVLGTDWDEGIGSNFSLIKTIIINQNLTTGDTLTFRIASSGGVYFSELTGAAPSLNDAYNSGSTITVNSGDPVKINAGTDTALKLTGKLEVNTMTFPSTDGTPGQFLKTDGFGILSWDSVGSGGNDYQLQQLNSTQVLSNWTSRLSKLHIKNTNAKQSVVAYAHGVTAVSYAYVGGVYSPTQNRIYLVPNDQSNQSNWHYIDCATGSVVAYAHGVTAVSSGYFGGVYSPTQNRIYLVPSGQASQSNWHYINCATGSVVAYAHGVTAVSYAYFGGVYSPTQNRIYLVPYGQSNESNWHYIDCATGSVVAYAHGVTAVSSGYVGGVYSPTQNRIYLVPHSQASQSNWHYIDCATGSVVAYAHGVALGSYAYAGGVYSPTQNRIYLVPHSQASQSNWHYIDCATGSVVAYAHGVAVGSYAYVGGVYSPTQNRIYLVPYNQSNQSNWHYIDCATGSVVAYAHGVAVGSYAYFGGVYSPTQNRIYLVPYNQANQSNWHCITSTAKADMEPHEFGSTIISSTL